MVKKEEKSGEQEALRRVHELELEKIKLEDRIAALTREQGIVLSEMLSKEDAPLPKVSEEVPVDLGMERLSGMYRVTKHTYLVSHSAVKKGERFTGDFKVDVVLTARGVKLRTRKKVGEAERELATKTYTMSVKRDEVYPEGKDPNETLPYRRKTLESKSV